MAEKESNTHRQEPGGQMALSQTASASAGYGGVYRLANAIYSRVKGVHVSTRESTRALFILYNQL